MHTTIILNLIGQIQLPEDLILSHHLLEQFQRVGMHIKDQVLILHIDNDKLILHLSHNKNQYTQLELNLSDPELIPKLQESIQICHNLVINEHNQNNNSTPKTHRHPQQLHHI